MEEQTNKLHLFVEMKIGMCESMKIIYLLEEDDVIEKNDFIRPLYRMADYSQSCDDWSEGDYFKWKPTHKALGDFWFGKTHGEFIKGTRFVYEFCRGEIPQGHIEK